MGEQRVWSGRNLYHLHHGGELLMLTADTLLHAVTQTLHPLLNPHTPTPSLLHSEAQADVYSPPFPLLFLSILTSSCLWSIIPALPPSFPLLHLSASLCSATLLCSLQIQHAVSWQAEEEKQTGCSAVSCEHNTSSSG